jgi:hypothetical protein
MIRRIVDAVGSIVAWSLKKFLISGVRLYQIFLSPFLGGRCRFHPSCSHYFIQAVEKYGPLRGAIKGILRICRCHPFHPGGYDPP